MIGTTRIIKTSGRGCIGIEPINKKNKLIFFTLIEYVNIYLSVSLEKRFTNQIIL